jgi:hypothetical protein
MGMHWADYLRQSKSLGGDSMTWECIIWSVSGVVMQWGEGLSHGNLLGGESKAWECIGRMV